MTTYERRALEVVAGFMCLSRRDGDVTSLDLEMRLAQYSVTLGSETLRKSTEEELALPVNADSSGLNLLIEQNLFPGKYEPVSQSNLMGVFDPGTFARQRRGILTRRFEFLDEDDDHNTGKIFRLQIRTVQDTTRYPDTFFRRDATWAVEAQLKSFTVILPFWMVRPKRSTAWLDVVAQ